MSLPSDTPFHTIQVGDESFPCEPEQTLLLAALAAGLQLPNSCRNGTCRTCIAFLLEGKIQHRIKWPGLSFEEKKEGWILPCVACPRSDVKIAISAV